MKEVKGNIWDYYDKGYYVVIPTNGCVKKNGRAVMGKGLALQANEFFGDVALSLGRCISYGGNAVYLLSDVRLISFPTKYHWSDMSDINLIGKSVNELLDIADMLEESEEVKIALPKVGCGNGNLKWDTMKQLLTEYLDDRFIIVDTK